MTTNNVSSVPPKIVRPKINPAVYKFDFNIGRRIFRFVQPYPTRIALGFALMFTSVFDAIFGPSIIGKAMDDGLARNDLRLTFSLVIIYLVITAISQVSSKFQIQTMVRLGQSVIRDMRQVLYEHIQDLSEGFFARYEVGRLISRMMGDVQLVREFIVFAIIAIVRDLIVVGGILLVMISLSLPLAAVLAVLLPILFVFAFRWSIKSREVYTAVRELTSSVNARLAEDFNGVRVVQAFAREDFNYRRFREGRNKEVLDISLKSATVLASFFPVLELLSGMALFGLVLVGGLLVLNNGLTAGVLVAFVLYIEQLFNPIRDLAQRWNVVQQALASGGQVFQVLDEKPDIVNAPGAVDMPPGPGRVVFDDVSFSYGGKSAVLDHVSLDVKPGQKVAFVGHTGAGKTTMIKLIMRFYDVTGGALRIDGYDIREVTQHSLRSRVGVVLQETHLFSDTIMNNLRLGRQSATDEDVIEAAKALGAHEFISALPDGYQTRIRKGAAILSVGQRQLLSFVRAMVADPSILILDEATSNIDTATERVIQDAIGQLMTGRTSFVIAHRLSTITQSDVIVVMDHGKIIEQGTHLELLAQRQHYFDLYTMAYHGEDEDAAATVAM